MNVEQYQAPVDLQTMPASMLLCHHLLSLLLKPKADTNSTFCVGLKTMFSAVGWATGRASGL